MKLQIRTAKIEDLKQINEIAKQVHDLHVRLRPDVYVFQKEVMPEAVLKELLNDGLVFVGESDDKIVSYAVCFIRERNHPLATKGQVMFLDAIGIEEKYRECGIGTKMMDHVIAYGRSVGCDRLELQVNSTNTAALDFYKKIGMKEKMQILELDIKGKEE